MDALDIKLNDAFPGKVVRKDLLHEIKRAVNVPSFVLEFLLSRYCASEDPEEIEEGKKAVLQTIEKCYVQKTDRNCEHGHSTSSPRRIEQGTGNC